MKKIIPEKLGKSVNENKGGKIIYKEDRENVFFLALHASYIIKNLSVRDAFSN